MTEICQVVLILSTYSCSSGIVMKAVATRVTQRI